MHPAAPTYCAVKRSSTSFTSTTYSCPELKSLPSRMLTVPVPYTIGQAVWGSAGTRFQTVMVIVFPRAPCRSHRAGRSHWAAHTSRVRSIGAGETRLWQCLHAQSELGPFSCRAGLCPTDSCPIQSGLKGSAEPSPKRDHSVPSVEPHPTKSARPDRFLPGPRQSRL